MRKSALVAILVLAASVWGASMLRADPVAPRAKWEYRLINGPYPAGGKAFASGFETEINKASADGWEYEAQLGDAKDGVVLLKRAR
jgi:hypothetical protein